MFKLEDAIKQWNVKLAANPAMDEGTVAELESHLRDRIDELSAEGSDPEAAFRQAAVELGSPGQAAAEFFKVHTTRLSGRPPRIVPALLWNYLKSTLRTVKRHKSFTFINITGLTVGLTCFILIMTFVRFEQSHDRFHKNADRIHRFTYRSVSGAVREYETGCPDLLAQALAEHIPGIHRVTRVMESWQDKTVLVHDRKGFLEHGLFADESFLSMFSFPLLGGSSPDPLQAPDSIVLSEKAARKLFGMSNPMGQSITFRERSSQYELTVTAVMKDIPRNSHLDFDYIGSVATLAADKRKSFMFNNWNVGNFLIYVELSPGADKAAVEQSIVRHLETNMPTFREDPIEVSLQPLTSIYLNSVIEGERSSNKRFQTLYLFIAIAIIILFLACLNYTNLSSARVLSRSKEVGLRKVAGASRFDLVCQFVGESVLYAFFSLALALGISLILIRMFGFLIDIDLYPGDVFHTPMVPILLSATLLAGLLSGIYPGLVLSSFKPVQSIRDLPRTGRSKIRIRNLLVVIQFVSAVSLMICTSLVYRQLSYIRNSDQGYRRDRIVVIPMHDQLIKDNAGNIKNALLAQQEVDGVTVSGSGGYPVSVRSRMGKVKVGAEEGETLKMDLRFDYVDEDFIDVMGLTLLAGRNFSRQYGMDSKGILVNETLVRMAGWKNPLGKKLDIFGTEREKDPRHVIGVVSDFRFDTVHTAIAPAVLINSPGNFISVRLKPGDTEHSLSVVRKTFEQTVPGQPFDFFFLDDAFDQLYRNERKTGEMLAVFSILAGFIACLGLFGMAAYTTERRTREIGIRKVLGASTRTMLLMLNQDFLVPVAAAILLSWPLSYYLMKNWLRAFAYNAPLNWGTFLLAGLFSLFIAGLTVSYQAFSAAGTKPVDSLKYE